MTSLVLDNLSVRFKARPILREISLTISSQSITTILGASGSGKSTLLRTINRLIDEEPGFICSGALRLGLTDLFRMSRFELRRRIGIVFQKPIVFPITIRKNVLFGASVIKKIPRRDVDEFVQRYLTEAGLWEEVANRLDNPATKLSVGQQQRLTIARALALEPEIILMDEPTSALDSKAASRFEELVKRLRQTRTIVLVTHDHGLASRVSDRIFVLQQDADQGSRLEPFHS